MIRGLSSFPTRLCPAITARGLSDSILIEGSNPLLPLSADLATLTDADDRRCRRHHRQRSNSMDGTWRQVVLAVSVYPSGTLTKIVAFQVNDIPGQLFGN